MQQIYLELQAEETGHNIEIFGINWNPDSDASIDLMTQGRDLPFLKDTNAEKVRNQWAASYRDVIILDSLNLRVDPPFNLSANSLSIADNRDALKAKLRGLAEYIDSDNDGLGDDWEELLLGDLSSGSDDDPDGDQRENFLEYAFGSRPDSASGLEMLTPSTSWNESAQLLSLSFRRRLGAGGGLTYEVEQSENGTDWNELDVDFTTLEAENPYDGTGTEKVTVRIPESDRGAFFRVRLRR